jgi:cysteine-rich repeat protein
VALVDCDDGDPCTDDLCTENLGCEHPLNTAPCEDGNLCTVGDTCSGGLCVPGGPPDCDDGNPCTDDLCQSDQGCTAANNTGPCDDGNVCTLGDTCSGGACVGAGALSCDDQNACTDDICDSIDGCLHILTQGDCDDGDPCTMEDSCIGTQCQGQEKECSDLNPCTNDVCELGICLHPANTADCNDGNPCTTIDYCLNGWCIGTDPLDCGDGNPCTNDSCDHTSGCQNTPNFDLCDDGDPCTAQSQCQSKVCVGVAFMQCEDGNVCTDDECVTGVGCVTTNNTQLCDDQKACTSNDQCEDGVCTGEQSGNLCTDGNPCTTDTCTDAGGCAYELNTQPCDDGNPCTENDACSVGQCEGVQKVCEADEPCVDAYCAENGVCVDEIEGSCCGNGEIDPGETCDDGNQNDGDGCPANCLQGSCPAGSASLHGFCWVIATSLAGVDQGHPQACASIGKAKTDTKVNVPWDAQTLSDVASLLGYSSIGTYACCAHAMWCNAGNGTCGTHNMGSPFHNYGPYADSAWWPVYTCYP